MGVKVVKDLVYSYIEIDESVQELIDTASFQRLKRMIISSGFNVYPSQIEKVLKTDSRIDNCVVVGQPHPYKVEVPVAYIVLKKDGYDTWSKKISITAGKLLRLKNPRILESNYK